MHEESAVWIRFPQRIGGIALSLDPTFVPNLWVMGHHPANFVAVPGVY
jgi:hypothetical protein